jgi:nucleoside 2-deoxyribosyltransferase
MNVKDRADELYASLSKPERLWFDEIYQIATREDFDPDVYVIRARLDGQVPTDFDHSDIPNKLLRGYRPSLLGYLAKEDDDSLLDDMTRIVSVVREIFIDHKKEGQRSRGMDATLYRETIDLSRERENLAVDLLGDIGFQISFERGQAEGADDDPDRLKKITLESDSRDNILKFDGDLTPWIQERFFPESEPSDERAQEDTGIEEAARVINPIFRSRIDRVDEKLGFVIMPFHQKEIRGVYKNVIRAALEDDGPYRCQRADDAYGEIVMENVWTKISEAGFIVADLTGLNPNVMYELGIAHTLGKPVISIIQNIDELPFDVQHHTVIEYTNDTEGGPELQRELLKAVPEVIEANKKRNKENYRLLNRMTGQNAFFRPQTGPFGGGLVW